MVRLNNEKTKPNFFADLAGGIGSLASSVVDTVRRATSSLGPKVKEISQKGISTISDQPLLETTPFTAPFANIIKSPTVGETVSGLSKTFLYEPEKKRLFPSSPVYQFEDLQKLSPDSPEYTQKLRDFSLNMALNFMGGVESKPGLSKELAKGIEKQVVKTGTFTPLTKVGEEIINPASDPVEKIITALKGVSPIREIQEKLFTQERARKFAQAEAMGKKVGGEAGFFAEKGQLKGELPKVGFESIRNALKQSDIDSLFTRIRDHKDLLFGEKLTAQEGLSKLLGEKGTSIPTESELKLLNEVFGEEFTKTVLQKRPLFQKLWDTAGQILSIPRSLMAGGFDMSFGLRQGIFSAYRQPKEWFSAFKNQFKYFLDEKAVQALDQQIKSRPTYSLMRQSKLDIMDLGTQLGKREEQFAGSLAEKIPFIGKLIRASTRAYTGFANQYRADLFDSLVKVGQKTGAIQNPGWLDAVSDSVNTLTGRGSFKNIGLPALERSSKLLSTTLFSPRLLASRLSLLNPFYYATRPPEVRRRALETLLAFVTGTSTILGAAKLAGADVETDLTSADFGKIRIGNTRFDIMGGFQQPIVLLARILSGKLKSSTSGLKLELGKGYKPTTRLDVISRYFESKEAPIISFLTNILKGESQLGEPLNVKKEVLDRVTPLFIQDLIDLYKEGGFKDLPLGIPGFFGAGVQTYGPTSPKDIRIQKLEQGGKRQEAEQLRKRNQGEYEKEIFQRDLSELRKRLREKKIDREIYVREIMKIRKDYQKKRSSLFGPNLSP